MGAQKRRTKSDGLGSPAFSCTHSLALPASLADCGAAGRDCRAARQDQSTDAQFGWSRARTDCAESGTDLSQPVKDVSQMVTQRPKPEPPRLDAAAQTSKAQLHMKALRKP